MQVRHPLLGHMKSWSLQVQKKQVSQLNGTEDATPIDQLPTLQTDVQSTWKPTKHDTASVGQA